jgi:hypothetical protein
MHEDNSLPSPEPTEDRPLADHELAAVTGGTSDRGLDPRNRVRYGPSYE